MKMKNVSKPSIELEQFVELVLMWFCSGDIPMNRVSTQEFIEDDSFIVFFESIKTWSNTLGVECPLKADVVRTLHSLYSITTS